MKNNATVLVVDDTEENVLILSELLKDYDVVEAYDGETALNIVAAEDIKLILLDIMMPEMDGFEVARRLKADPKTADIPIIFITAKTDEDSIDQAYQLGGVDYISKPFKARELLARVRTQIQVRDIIQELEFLASRDVMTNIYNRRKFFDLAEASFQSSELDDSEQNSLYAIMIDIDKFKRINDSYGHSVGDEVIKAGAQYINDYLQNSINKDAIFGRIGGEEFAITCTSTSLESMQQLCEDLRAGIEQLEIPYADELIKFTISSGLSLKTTNDNLDALLKRADDALYQAKSSGRNQVCYCE